MTVTVEQRQTEDPPPDRLPVMLVAAVLVIAWLILPAGEDLGPAEDVDDQRQPSPSTSLVQRSSPSSNIGPPILPGHTLVDARELAAGPQLGWSELTLPEATTAVHVIDEFDGRLAAIVSTEAADARGVYVDASFFTLEPSGDWSQPLWTLPEGTRIVTADIGPAGVVMIGTDRDSARAPYAATDITAFATSDGSVWTTTTLAAAGERTLTNISATVGNRSTGSWITALTVVDDHPHITPALPQPYRDLVLAGSASLHVSGTSAEVKLPIGFVLYEADLSDLDVLDRIPSPTLPREDLVWWSRSTSEFELTDDIGTDPTWVLSTARGSDGRVLALDASNRVFETADGVAWSPAAEMRNAGFGQASVGSVAQRVLGVHSQQVLTLTGGTRDFVFDPPEGRGISPNVPAASGPAGLAILTAGNGPGYSVSIDPVDITRGDRSLRIDTAGRRILVERDGMIVDEFSPDADQDRVSFDPATNRLRLGSDPALELTTADLERAYLAALRADVRGPYGVLFTEDGVRWGWSSLRDGNGAVVGPVAQLAVGANAVFAVVDAPQLETAPRTDSGYVPRLFVGTTTADG